MVSSLSSVDLSVVDRLRDEALARKRLRQDGDVDVAQPQRLQELDRQPLLQDQRHLRRAPDHRRHQRGQEVRAYGVDDAQAQRARQRILALLGDLLDRRGLLQHPLGLLDDLRADRCDAHLGAAALEELDAEFVLQLLDRDRKRRLAHEAGLRRPSEVAFTGNCNNVL
jgi:hypothetical protein